MDNINLDKNRTIKLVGIMVLSIGLLTFVILAQQQQNIRSKASEDVYNAFDVTNKNGNQLQYKDKSGVRTYETKSLDVKIKVIDLERLIE